MDAAFFQRRILQGLAARDCGYAIKVGYWSWLPLKPIAAACRRWQPVAPRVTGHETELAIPPWNNLRLRVVLYRKHVGHRTDAEELPAGSVHARRRALRILRRRD